MIPTFMPFFFHWYIGLVPPFTVVAVKVTGVPLQIILLGFAAMVTDGVSSGFTVIVAVCGAPEQPLSDGVTVIVAVTGDAPVLNTGVAGMLLVPEPEADMPMAGTVLVHEKVVSGIVPVNNIGVVAEPLHTGCDVGVTVTFGIRFTVTAWERAIDVPQPLMAVAVTLSVPLVAVLLKLIDTLFPVPVIVAPVPL